ncbi:MAG: peptidylprolyl isomerase, partial [Prevotella sp.]
MKLQTIGKAFAATLFTVGATTISTATNGNMHWAGTAENDTTTTTVKTTTDSIPESSVIDEVIWVVGDEPILKSDVEVARMQMEMEGEKIDGDPDFRVPEQLAIQKLFLHQAELDSVQVTDAEVTNGVERQLNAWIQAVGSREKLEEYRGQSITAIREGLRTDYRNQLLIQEERKKIVGDIAVTPADVRRYFEKLPADSLPYVPTEVEVQILMQHPKIPQEEINRVKDRLREFTDRINKGETTFATLARLYSEDGSARQGGELGYMGRGILDPAFALVAFNLTDPKKVSK